MIQTSSTAHQRIHTLLHRHYPANEAEAAYQQVIGLLQRVPLTQRYSTDYFSERTVTLITYANTLRQPGEAPLKTLHQFLSQRLEGIFDTVHILPFYPYSSDDGFSVLDYFAVAPELGTWYDVRELGADFRLMVDAVINHMSAQSGWFKSFLAGDPGFRGLFRTESPDADLSSVTRPRTTPLLTPFQKADGQTVHVWTTFSADQVDLDYRDPQTLLRVLQALLFYVGKGAQVIRLDAIAYLWKKVGTSCIHLPETHIVVQLLRAALDAVAPHVILITETNVPHAENVSYFGNGTDEAQLVYNFTLPPLLLHTLVAGNAGKLRNWVNGLTVPSGRTAFLNFTASHDGIGVRPVEGILTAGELQVLIDTVDAHGGRISYKVNADGSRDPYELNISFVDAIAPADMPVSLRVRRFMISQGIMLALAGIPAVYIHSLLGSQNNIEGMLETGHSRAINRAKMELAEIEPQLDDPTSFCGQIFKAYTHLLKVRISSRAFHPSGGQRAFDFNQGGVFALERTAPHQSERILALFNVTGHPQPVQLPERPKVDILTGEPCSDQRLTLAPFEMRWLRL